MSLPVEVAHYFPLLTFVPPTPLYLEGNWVKKVEPPSPPDSSPHYLPLKPTQPNPAHSESTFVDSVVGSVWASCIVGM